jgi:hypothetical protein
MNDLERDLRELLRNQAASVDAPTLAPEPVLRRSRRRQIRTVAGGAAATAIVLAAAVVAIGTLRNPTGTVPSAPIGFAERTATIGGVPVTAPAGWTLIDDSPMARFLPASSESCSFSATASPVTLPGGSAASTGDQAGAEGSPVSATDAEPSCSSSPVAQAAGIPVLQLTNVELPLIGFVCDVTGIDPTDFPSNGVAAYVAEFPNGLSTAEFDRACPGSEEIQTFADESGTTVLAAVSVVGPNASAEDAALVRDFVQGLDGIRIARSEPSTAGPGYVVAAGTDGGTPWRIEAGISSLGTSGASIGAMLVVTDPDGHESSDSSPPSDEISERASELADGSWLQWGTDPASTTAITGVAADGTRTNATLLSWPDGLRPFTDATLDGTIWYLVAMERGTLERVGASPAP